MGFGLGDIALGLASPAVLLGKKLFYDKPKEEQERADQAQADVANQRQQLKQKQYEYMGQMQGPSMTPAMERRLRALEEQSQPGELSQDPYFQASRANLVQGGQQALSGIQNQQAAYGTQGGFKNQGSVSDVYDRLGAQMAQLGQKSVGLKDEKAQQVAKARQDIEDAKTSYANAQIQAKIAIEAGDTQSAIAAIQQAYAAKEAIIARQWDMVGKGLSAAGGIAGGMIGGPVGAAAGSQPGNMVSANSQSAAADPFAAGLAPRAQDLQPSQPWSAQKRSYSLGGY